MYYYYYLQVGAKSTAPVTVYLPAMVVAAGCAIDNLRLSMGVMRLGKLLSYISFFLHVTAVPLLIISIIYIVQVSVVCTG